LRPTYKAVPFVPSPHDVVERMLDIAAVGEGETVYDLGCGDGRILFTAALKHRAKAIGYEKRDNLVLHVRRKARELRIDDLVRVVDEDLFRASLENADVVTLYLTTDVLQNLRPKLEEELKPSARVVSHDFAVPGWTPVHVEKFRSHRIFLYMPGKSFMY